MSDTNSPREWRAELSAATDASQIVAVLQELSAHEDVRGIARQCLDLLSHKDSNVRLWASEVLESAARPTADETQELTNYLDGLLDQQAASSKKKFVWPGTQPAEPDADSAGNEKENSLRADQMYWAATMLGRIGPDAASADVVLARLEGLAQDAGAAPFHDAAARAKVMRTRCTS
ncbi:hypothetical protein [Rhodopirellula sallentina]|uniref:hypothetical protein n=1 Tax=Rhodopirellula sallentina TaxID=1263869 RepID=UPI0005C7C80C|nr:hypothetical protein [Rhodopirellula sallentina]